MKHLLFTFWSYSNGEDLLDMEVDIKFTFHYGPIQIINKFRNVVVCAHLHSTMVLFKSFISRSVSSASISFTFHYGRIQIEFWNHSS